MPKHFIEKIYLYYGTGRYRECIDSIARFFEVDQSAGQAIHDRYESVFDCIASGATANDQELGRRLVCDDETNKCIDEWQILKGNVMQPYKIRVIIADDHPAIVEGIKQSISVSTIEIVDTARNSTQIIQMLDKGIADVLVTDYAMPGGEFGDGLPLFEFILRRYPGIKIVVMTMMDNPGVLRTLMGLGVRCIISKSDDASHLIPAIHIVSSQGQYFSPTINSIVQTLEKFPSNDRKIICLSKRESEVIRLYVSGMKINDIAVQLHRSKQTVSSQKNSAMKKLGVVSEANLFKYALEVGLVPSSSTPLN